MKITVLDGYALNSGDLSWAWLDSLGQAEVFDRTPEDMVIERAKDSYAVYTNKVVFDAETLAQLPKLKFIGVLATGYNVVDVEEAHRRGITVTNIPAYSTMSVAQSVFALILALTNRVEHYSGMNRNGEWGRSPDFCFWDTPLIELDGKTLGIVGLGNIGKAVAKIGLAFGMKVIASTSKSQEELPAGIVKRELDQVFAESDFLTLHCPLTPQTRHLVDSHRLGLMKPTAFLINTSRGDVVCEEDLSEALHKGTIAGAGLDVLSKEPPADGNPLLEAPNCMVTPHIAWATREARQRLMHIAEQNLRAFIAGHPVNTV